MSTITLPPTGKARVKSVLSGDTVVLVGTAPAPNVAPPEVLFTLDGILAPRYVVLIYPSISLTTKSDCPANPLPPMNQVRSKLVNSCANGPWASQ